MKKKSIHSITIDSLCYPNLGIGRIADRQVQVKQGLPGQQLSVQINRARRTKTTARILSVERPANYEVPSFCEHFGSCGGCARQTVPYARQLQLKAQAVAGLFAQSALDIPIEDILASPQINEYRNKMEYSFGDLEKGGQLNLGMHRKGRFYDVVSIPHCHLIDGDYRLMTQAVECYCRQRGWSRFNRNTGKGLLRNLVIRKGHATGEILIGIATSSDDSFDAQGFVDCLLDLTLAGTIVGIYHLISDDVADVVKAMPDDHLIYGRDYFYEELLGLRFKISFHSFFQTNSRGAEVLYRQALSMIPDLGGKIVYDLFSGTGTIAQIVSKRATRVYGIEIIEAAVLAARENAAANGITNCTFLTGDVFRILDDLTEAPDVIIVDPPRAGMTPKTVQKLANYGVEQLLYISCNPKTMVANLVDFQALGYRVERCILVDMYPHTPHVEAICLLTKNDD